MSPELKHDVATLLLQSESSRNLAAKEIVVAISVGDMALRVRDSHRRILEQHKANAAEISALQCRLEGSARFRFAVVIECVANAADRAESGSYDMAGTPKAKAIAIERANRLYALASRLESARQS